MAALAPTPPVGHPVGRIRRTHADPTRAVRITADSIEILAAALETARGTHLLLETDVGGSLIRVSTPAPRRPGSARVTAPFRMAQHRAETPQSPKTSLVSLAMSMHSETPMQKMALLRQTSRDTLEAVATPTPSPGDHSCCSSGRHHHSHHDHDDEQRRLRGLLQLSRVCLTCHRIREVDDLIHLDDCMHTFCTSCLRSHCRAAVKRGGSGDIGCPLTSCQAVVSGAALKQVLSGRLYDRLMSNALDHLIATNPQFFRCPNKECGLVMERIENPFIEMPPAGQVTDKDGNPLTEEAYAHREACRFRCPECTLEFCSDCGASPYHLGYTCEQHAAYLNARHCRFCSATVVAPAFVEPAPLGGSPGRKALARRWRKGKSKKGAHQQQQYQLPGQPSVLADVCHDAECIGKMSRSCARVHRPCGHACVGIRSEKQCPPCIHPDCAAEDATQTSDDFCVICWTETLSQGPCLQLECGHFFHQACLQTKLRQRFPGARITFSFLDCPLCKKRISHPALEEELKPILALEEEVRGKALTRLSYEGLDKDPQITEEGGRFFEDPTGFAMDRFTYYPCYVCGRAYFGGQRRCDQGDDDEGAAFDPSELVCGGCSNTDSVQQCEIHGSEFMEFKCAYCCSIASWYCWGKTRFCNDCHERQQRGDYLTKKPLSSFPKCEGAAKCPLKVNHPPHGTEFALGCAICRNAQTF